jgi:PAS domain S-box-containing protein
MELKKEQILSKTLKGIDAARGGGGISAKLRSALKLVDGVKKISDITPAAAKATGWSDAEVLSGLAELQSAGLVRIVETATAQPTQDAASAEVESQMLLTLDFTKQTQSHLQKAAAAAAAAGAKTAPDVRPAASAAAATAAPGTAADHDERAREAKAARLKLEADIRQKLTIALQPRVEEELRKRLRPKLEEELRPKLIAALRPGLEAELRTALTKELTPRIELELKARFAKTLAAQKAADEQAAREEAIAAPAPAPAPSPEAPAPAIDSGFERVLASMNVPVFSVDRTGVCTYVSPAWAQFSGFTADETVGKQLSDFFDDKSKRGITAMLVGICNGTALRFDQQGALVRKAGDPLWVELSAAPLYASNGDAEGVCGALRDAGESRRISEQAEADGVRLLLLVDQIDTGVVLENHAGEIQQVNPAFCALLSVGAAPYSLEGLPVSELLEQVSQGFIGPEGFLRRIADMRNEGDDVKGESFILADGRVVEVDYLAVTVGEETVGRVWLVREVRRQSAREPRAS